ncbi:Hypothetical predicted protein [Pelobates cultripes]|uniref:Uncharacterized protein n=1 Tax=Pelobates cultripes TaxID=61616 RepID=A0AAD1WCC1_PELCU|nr:Hypothetical predicted protein [Pelobates cultripes]
MGKRHKKLKALSCEGSRDIDELLQRGPRPKMAARREPSTSNSSEEELLDVPDTISETGGLNTPWSTEDLNTLFTRGDILELI